MPDAFDVYRIYTTTNLHFTSSYDILKYRGNAPNLDVRYAKLQNQSLFEGWKNSFRKVDDIYETAIANTILDNPKWVFGAKSDAISIYNKWKEVRFRIHDQVKEDFVLLHSLIKKKKVETFDGLIRKTPNGNLPPLLQLYLSGRILPDTVSIIDDLRSDCVTQWMEDYVEDPSIKPKIFMLLKYKPFVKYKKERIKMIFEEVLGEQSVTN